MIYSVSRTFQTIDCLGSYKPVSERFKHIHMMWLYSWAGSAFWEETLVTGTTKHV